MTAWSTATRPGTIHKGDRGYRACSRLTVLDLMPGPGYPPYGRAVAGIRGLVAGLRGHLAFPGTWPDPCPDTGRNRGWAFRPAWGGNCKGPPPDCRRIVIRLRCGVKSRCDRRATSTGKVPGARTRQSALHTCAPANRAAAVSPMGGEAAHSGPEAGVGRQARAL